MDWHDERYVRLYTRDTVNWKLMGWQARCLMPLLLRKADRAGCVDIGEDGAEGIAALVDIPVEVAEVGLRNLLARGAVVIKDGTLCFPKYMDAQEAKHSDRARQEESRGRKRDALLRKRDELSHGVTSGHTDEQSVTSGHAASPDVTPSRAVPEIPPVPPASGGPSACPERPTTGKLAIQGPPPIPDQPAEPSLPGMPSETAKAPRKRSKPGQDAAERDRCTLVATTLLNELSSAIQAVRPSAHRIRVLPATLKPITDRLMDGATVEEVRHVIAVYQADARRNPDTLVYFNHTTPFRPDNFERAKVRTVEDARKPRYQAPPQVRFGPPPPEEVERINRERRESDDLQAEGTRKAIEERRRIAARPGNNEERAAIAQMVKATEEDHGSQ